VDVRRLLLAGLVALLATAPAAPAAVAADAPEAKALLRLASRLSGLSVRRSVPVVVDRPSRIRLRRVAALDRARPRTGRAHDETVLRALGVATGGRGVVRAALVARATATPFYDTRTRRVHVRSRTPSRQALLHELVHALQDQHFDLRRKRRFARDRDASLAAAAAIEGHASLVAGLVERRAARAGGPRLRRYLYLERGFVASVGRRLAVDLRNLGGNRAAWSTLRRFPQTTEQVFHLDKLLERERPLAIRLPTAAAGLALASQDTFGELDVRALLAVHRVQRLDRTARGWGGGRSAVYRADGGEAVAVALDWDTELDAIQWADAAGRLALPRDRGVALVRAGARTALVVAVDTATAEAVARAIVPAAAEARNLHLSSSLSHSDG
jgi:hypothetical protein